MKWPSLPPQIAKKGFTLIELVVVVSLSIMLALAASALFMSFLISSTKVDAIRLVKSEGQYALSQMEFLIRNALEVVPNEFYADACQQDMVVFSVRSYDGRVSTFYQEIDPDDSRSKIASNSGVYLTSGDVEVTDGPYFDCTELSEGGAEHVNIQFTLRKGVPGVDQPEEIVEETFETSVNVRSL